MVFSKKPKLNLDKVADKVLELEERLNLLVGILQEDCPAVKCFLKNQPVQVQPAQQAKEKEMEDMKRVIMGQPAESAKQVLRL
jgi:hypothetical protein